MHLIITDRATGHTASLPHTSSPRVNETITAIANAEGWTGWEPCYTFNVYSEPGEPQTAAEARRAAIAAMQECKIADIDAAADSFFTFAADNARREFTR